MPQATTNKQTTLFCSKLGVYDPMALLVGTTTGGSVVKKGGNGLISREELNKAWDSAAERSQVWDSFEFNDSRTIDEEDVVGRESPAKKADSNRSKSSESTTDLKQIVKPMAIP